MEASNSGGSQNEHGHFQGPGRDSSVAGLGICDPQWIMIHIKS